MKFRLEWDPNVATGHHLSDVPQNKMPQEQSDFLAVAKLSQHPRGLFQQKHFQEAKVQDLSKERIKQYENKPQFKGNNGILFINYYCYNYKRANSSKNEEKKKKKS